MLFMHDCCNDTINKRAEIYQFPLRRHIVFFPEKNHPLACFLHIANEKTLSLFHLNGSYRKVPISRIDWLYQCWFKTANATLNVEVQKYLLAAWQGTKLLELNRYMREEIKQNVENEEKDKIIGYGLT